jgi:hypothetical protein
MIAADVRTRQVARNRFILEQSAHFVHAKDAQTSREGDTDRDAIYGDEL